jgi:hypothetical protein
MVNDPKVPLWPADNPAILTHINLLQGVINRLADNSSSCKTWCLTLVSALLSLAGATHVPGIAACVILPIIIFGFVDAMYLAEEKSYRQLFNRTVIAVRDGSYRSEDLFEVVAPLSLENFRSSLRSWAILPVYGVLILAYIFIMWSGWLTVLTHR